MGRIKQPKRSLLLLLLILFPKEHQSSSFSSFLSGLSVGCNTCQLFLRYRREIFFLGVLGFLKMTRSFPKIPEELKSLPKKSKVFQRHPKSSEDVRSINASSLPVLFFVQKSEIARKVLSFIHFTHDFCSLHGSKLPYLFAYKLSDFCNK